MSDVGLADFELQRELSSTADQKLWEAHSRAEGRRVLVTVFSPDVSQLPEFRRGLKTDRAMLLMLHHQSVNRFLGSGETDGTLFLWSEFSDFPTLNQHFADGREFSADDIIEIGWQICSALQQAHNLGLSHGGICADTVRISDNLQVTVTDFGVARWLHAAKTAEPQSSSGPALITVRALASREQVEKDLRDLALLLKALFDRLQDEPAENRSVSRVLLERMLGRFLNVNSPQLPVTAREFQGRLGEILIGNEEAMPLVDERKSVGTSKRSIVVELFEPRESLSDDDEPASGSAGSAARMQILPIVAGIALVVIITLIAVLIW